MRNDKVVFPYLPIPEPYDIQIQGPRAPMPGSSAAFLPLDLLQRLKQCPGLQGGLHQRHLVEIRRLPHTAERLRFLNGRNGDQGRSRQRCEGFPGGTQVLMPVAQVASQGDIDPLSC